MLCWMHMCLQPRLVCFRVYMGWTGSRGCLKSCTWGSRWCQATQSLSYVHDAVHLLVWREPLPAGHGWLTTILSRQPYPVKGNGLVGNICCIALRLVSCAHHCMEDSCPSYTLGWPLSSSYLDGIHSQTAMPNSPTQQPAVMS